MTKNMKKIILKLNSYKDKTINFHNCPYTKWKTRLIEGAKFDTKLNWKFHWFLPNRSNSRPELLRLIDTFLLYLDTLSLSNLDNNEKWKQAFLTIFFLLVPVRNVKTPDIWWLPRFFISFDCWQYLRFRKLPNKTIWF